MWSPTHVQVTVQKARGLIHKGKNGTNDAFVTIALGKEKFQTSIKEKIADTVEWHEKCELVIPKQGNRAEIVLTALHHNRMAVDEFLGRVSIPLVDMDIYDRPKNVWYKLKDKPGKEKNKERGELEVKIAFIVKAGSLSDLSKKGKHKSSLGQLSQAAQSFGGSLISISSLDKRKGLRNLATKIGNKITKSNFKKKDELSNINNDLSSQSTGEPDPGVISEIESEDDFMLDELSQKSSGTSLNISSKTRSVENMSTNHDFLPPAKPPRFVTSTLTSSVEEKKGEEQHLNKRDINVGKDTYNMERIIIGREMTRTSSPINTIPADVLKQYAGKSREDLIQIIHDLQTKLSKEMKRQKDLEDYLDQLLLKVMETSPRILQNPYMKKGKV
ncbi:rab11 family-interacting protein 1 [Cimex lectularius]|uniref:Rab11 family-interacting protein 2 n=1 Tax=Cimex lectularius TaxID=79782 RepID=A0A8I6RP87_CIMLE|nr:rab11 family-interacting protein 1 [Cimex lectularius]